MNRFTKHLLIAVILMVILIPVMLIILFNVIFDIDYKVVEQYSILYEMIITEADGTEYREYYTYNNAKTEVTCEYFKNDELYDTKVVPITQDDPLLNATYEVMPRSDVSAASTERIENGSYVTIRYFDADGRLEGWSELAYNTGKRLNIQEDFDADGNLVRTTVCRYYTSTKTDAEITPRFDVTSPTE